MPKKNQVSNNSKAERDILPELGKGTKHRTPVTKLRFVLHCGGL
jgi:hypothetical protein